jgi:hypothetical protein
VRHDFPDTARRERLITPARMFQAQMDEARIAGGQKPLHPELAEVFPDTYSKAGIKWDGVSRLSRPKEPRARKDPLAVSGLTNPGSDYMIATLKSRMGSYQASNTGPGVDLSAETPRLAVTPAPRGKPGGPGLYDVQGMGHSPYLQNVVKALINKRGMPSGKAYAIARASIRKWSAKSKHAEVRSAATAAESDELAKQARAKASHSHATVSANARAITLSGDGWRTEERAKDGQWVGALGDLASKIDSEHPGKGIGDEVRKARDAARAGDRKGVQSHLSSAQGMFRDRSLYAGGRGDTTYRNAVGNSQLIGDHLKHASWTEMSGQPGGIEMTGTAAGAAQDPRLAAGSPGGGQFGSGGQPQNKARTKASLLAKAAADRQKARALMKQRAVLVKALASASGKVSRGQAGSKTASNAPAKTTASAPATAGRGGTAAKPGKRVSRRAQIAQLTTQINQLLSQAAQLTAQAKKL